MLRHTDPTTVAMGVPTRGHPGVWTVTTLEALREVHPGMPMIRWVESHHSVCDTRNQLVRWFLDETKCEYLVSFDDDCVPHYDILGIVDHHVDVVASPMMINRNEAPVPFPNVFLWQPETDDHKVMPNPFSQVGLVTHPHLAVGSGCICIRRRVLETVRPAFMHRWKPDGTIAETEDLNFCRLARQAGFSIYADYDRPSDQVVQVALHQLQDRFALAHQRLAEEREEVPLLWTPR